MSTPAAAAQSGNDDLVSKWTAEFELGGIPSSVRTTPSGAVEWGFGELKKRNFPLRDAADIGCGKGRNSLYLARQGMHVTAMDFTPNAIEALEQSAASAGLADKIRALEQDVTEPWSMASRSVDFAVDAFCFKHITPHEARTSYKAELLRVLRVRGHYLISFASIGDGYYGRYVTKRIDEHMAIVTDPANGIESVLFSRAHVLTFFEPELDLVAEIHNNKPSAMHGQIYERSTYALLLGRNPRQFIES